MKFKSNSMNLNINNAVEYLTFKNWEKYSFLTHAFSTRIGGVSKNEFKSMNLKTKELNSKVKDPDFYKNMKENYKIFFDAIKIDIQSSVHINQIHGNNVLSVSKKDLRDDPLKGNGLTDADGLVTNIPGIALITKHADCVPVYFVDPVKKVIGLVHAGWRGTVKLISGNAVQKMKNEFGCLAENIMCALGPCIGKCCFEVDEPVYREFESLKDVGIQKFARENQNGKFNMDLVGINVQILENFGIPRSNIIVSDLCTSCRRDLLFSYRATEGKCGLMIAVMQIKEQY